MAYERTVEISEDENCRVSITPGDDSSDLIEIAMSEDLAERFDGRATAVGLSREAFLRYLLDGGTEPGQS